MTKTAELTMSTKSPTNDPMPTKKQNGKDDKRKQGRPKVLSPDLDTRFQIRCSAKDVKAWEAQAEALGYGGASAWIRHVVNQALKQPSR